TSWCECHAPQQERSGHERQRAEKEEFRDYQYNCAHPRSSLEAVDCRLRSSGPTTTADALASVLRLSYSLASTHSTRSSSAPGWSGLRPLPRSLTAATPLPWWSN